MAEKSSISRMFRNVSIRLTDGLPVLTWAGFPWFMERAVNCTTWFMRHVQHVWYCKVWLMEHVRHVCETVRCDLCDRWNRRETVRCDLWNMCDMCKTVRCDLCNMCETVRSFSAQNVRKSLCRKGFQAMCNSVVAVHSSKTWSVPTYLWHIYIL